MIEREKYQPPADAIEALARCLLPAMRSYYESEERKVAFVDWKSQQDTEKSSALPQKKQVS